MMENCNWKEVKLGDCSNIITGFPFKSDEYEFNGKLRVVRGENVTIGNLRWDSEKYWNNNTDLLERYFLKEDDIVIGMDGSRVGQNRSLIKTFELPLILAQRVARIRANNDVNQLFIWYNIFSRNFKEYVEAIHTGTSIPHISLRQIQDFDIQLPPLPEQKAIASVLSSLDDKIDLLHQQNQTLEALAETLFRQWFIEEAKEDWEERPLSFYGKIICGKTPSKKQSSFFNGVYPFIKIPDMHGKTFVFETNDTLTEEGLKSQYNKTIPEKSINVSCIATVGLVTMNAYISQTNQQINSIIPIDVFRYYIFCQMKNSYELLQAMASGGTATPNLNTGDFSKITIPNPDTDILKKFNIEVSPIFDKIFENSKQIQTLTQLRDTLLPKLMSGEVRVKM